MEKKKRSIDQLSTALLKLLETKGYGHGTLKTYRYILSGISVFMKKSKVDSYTESIGDFFLPIISQKELILFNTTER